MGLRDTVRMVSVGVTSSDRVLGIDDDESHVVFDALSSESSRRVVAALNDGPATVSELSSRTGLTPQNVAYHLEKLTDAELVQPDGICGTGANEATVYSLAETTLLSTETNVASQRPPVGAIMLVIGLLLTLVCIHSLGNPSVGLHATIEHGFSHILALV
jgi:DNA-binding transcriptional ArsR family regulator